VSTFGTLIRLHKRRVDEVRRRLVELERLAEDLRERRKGLEIEFVGEQAVAAQSTESRMTYTAYAQVFEERCTKLAESLADVEREVDGVRDSLSSAVQELKRYETINAKREQLQRQVENRRQQSRFDEVALDRHRRGNKDS